MGPRFICQYVRVTALARAEDCSCTDCHRFTASLFATNFCASSYHRPWVSHPPGIKDESVEWVRGEDKVSTWTTSKTIRSGSDMTNHCVQRSVSHTALTRPVCKTCGSLIFRRSTNAGFQGWTILRAGGLDDASLRDTVFKPTMEVFIESRETWLPAIEGLAQHKGWPSSD